MLKWTIYLIIMLLCISIASAHNMTSANYKLYGSFVTASTNYTSTNYQVKGALGQLVVGNASSANYKVDHGILPPAMFIYPTPAGPSHDVAAGGSGGGGPDSGCAWGFYKNDAGECLPFDVTKETILGEDVAALEQRIYSFLDFAGSIGGKIYPKEPLLGWAAMGVFITGVMVIRKRRLEEKEKRKEIKKEDE